MDNLDLLLIEDNVNDAHLIERIITKEKLSQNYHWLRNGSLALEYFEEEKNPLPQFILLDIKMPIVNGFEVLSYLKGQERTKHIPVVIYSSSSQKSDIQKAYALGASSYLCKPASYQEMKNVFSLLFKYWIAFNKNTIHG